MTERQFSSYDDLRILVADDDKVNRFIIKKVLDKIGLHYKLIPNGQELLKEIRKGIDVHLILLDIQMPVLDGLSAFKILKEDLLIQDVIVFAMTANTMPEDQKKYLNAGMHELLEKPFTEEGLIRLIHKYFKFISKNDDQNHPS